MADLNYIQRTDEVKIAGQDSTGNNTNYVGADSNGNMQTKDYADGATGSAVPSVTTQVGGSDGTNLRTLKTDSSGRIAVNLNDNAGTAITLGQKVMASSIPVTISSDQDPVEVELQDGSGNSLTSTSIGGTRALDSAAQGNVASGTTDSGNPVKVGAVFNTTLPTITNGQRVDNQADSFGRLIVTNTPLDGYKATYSASITGLVAGLLPTDIFTISGSSSKTIRVLRLMFSGTEQNSAARDILLIKRSATNTGGTSSSPTAVPHDSNNSAATATVLAYTANPISLGSAVGTIRAVKIQLLATNVTSPLDKEEWNFGNRPGQGIVLRGTSQLLAVNLNGVTSASPSFDIDIEWTEE